MVDCIKTTFFITATKIISSMWYKEVTHREWHMENGRRTIWPLNYCRVQFASISFKMWVNSPSPLNLNLTNVCFLSKTPISSFYSKNSQTWIELCPFDWGLPWYNSLEHVDEFLWINYFYWFGIGYRALYQ